MTSCQAIYCTNEKGKCEKIFFVITGQDYKVIVRSNLQCCSTVWAPHTNKTKDEIAKVQRRAARFVTGRYHNTSNVSTMIDHLN